MAAPRPHLVGIAGGSGTGKTTLASALAAALDDTVVLPMDAYYRDLTDLEAGARAAWNFDAPEAFDWPLFLEALDALARGEPARQPTYEFSTHTRAATTTEVAPGRYVVVEGVLLLHHPAVRRRLHTRVFLEVPHEVAMARRVARDTRERGRDPDAVRARYERHVRPMFERHVLPTARWADLRLSGRAPVPDLVRRVRARLPDAAGYDNG